jgi:hypothetical protein
MQRPQKYVSLNSFVASLEGYWAWGDSRLADIFISYSQLDRGEVALLASYLETEGWTVWYDKSLSAGQRYRDEIMKQLAAARAVIVVWTPNSITSDFVRAEAGRAKAARKLIPLKTGNLDYHSIPLPFGEMHTENVEKRNLIRDAIVAELNKSQDQPGGIHLATANIRYAILQWCGIVGGALTIFANLKYIIDLANWARILVEHWTEWTHFIWRWLFAWLRIEVPKSLAPILTLAALMFSTMLGIYWSRAETTHREETLLPSMPRAHAGKVIFLTAIMTVSIAIYMGLGYETLDVLDLSRVSLLWYWTAFAALIILSRERVGTLIYAVTFVSMWGFMGINPAGVLAPKDGWENNLIGFLLLFTLSVWALPLLLLPAQPLNRRFLFILIGVGLLMGLNELSKLQLSQYLKV